MFSSDYENPLAGMLRLLARLVSGSLSIIVLYNNTLIIQYKEYYHLTKTTWLHMTYACRGILQSVQLTHQLT